MKTELRCVPHPETPGAQVFEIWYDGDFIGQVTGADGPGVRVISKNELAPCQLPPAMGVNITEVAIRVPESREYQSFREFVQDHGFADEKDFNNLVAGLDLTNPKVALKFEIWKQLYGTKEALLTVYNELKLPVPTNDPVRANEAPGCPGTGNAV